MLAERTGSHRVTHGRLETKSHWAPLKRHPPKDDKKDFSKGHYEGWVRDVSPFLKKNSEPRPNSTPRKRGVQMQEPIRVSKVLEGA